MGGVYDEKELARWRAWQLLEVSADKLVCDRPCFVAAISLVPAAAGASDAYVYNGHDAGGELKASLLSVTGDMIQERYAPPAYFNRGLYVDVDTNVQAVRILLLVDPKGW